jgi:hypothetical protein
MKVFQTAGRSHLKDGNESVPFSELFPRNVDESIW